MTLEEFLIAERSSIPLFAPVILGLGIIFGVFFPFWDWNHLLLFSLTSLIISAIIYQKSKILCGVISIFALGVYLAQTGGIFETNLLTQKKFIEHEYNNTEFKATVRFIEETHPTMKNMRRIIFKNIRFKDIKLDFIKTAKMTCSAKMSENIAPNDEVIVKGKILPLKLPAIPGAFDQIQYNSLTKIDTTGIVYFIKKINSTKSSIDYFSKMRRHLTKQILKKMPGVAGGIASSLLTGDKSSIPTEIREKFINSGTAHILAISGLHMSIVATIVFFTLMKIFQYASILVSRLVPKKLSAILTIPITFLYLALSGFSPSATRAFIMTSVFLCALIVERGSLTLRSVAVAAFLILVFDAGSIFLVSFQLSFCAVVALISFYESFHIRISEFKTAKSGLAWKLCFYLCVSFISTSIASVATLPISIAVFNRLSLCGFLGNIIAIPAVTFIIIPLGIISLVCGSFLNFPIDVLGFVINNLTLILGKIATIPGSNIVIKSPELLPLYLIISGGIVLCLLKTKAKFLGGLPIVCGSLIWIFQPKPDIIFPPNIPVACFVEDGKFYSTSLKKGRSATLSIRRNLGFSNKIIKKNFENLEIKKYPNGLYIWTKTDKHKQLAKSQHPFCPAYFADFNPKEK